MTHTPTPTSPNVKLVSVNPVTVNHTSVKPSDFVYDANYYDHYCGTLPYDQRHAVWRNHFRGLAAEIVERFAPKRTLDVGCAKGFLVEHLRDAAVEAFGLDVSEYAISQAAESVRPHLRLASATTPLDGRYDLITCIEMVEHMSEEDARKTIVNICAATDEVLFSSSPTDYTEASHFNVHPRQYWLSLFAEQGFYPHLHHRPGYVAEHAIHFRKLVRPLRVAVFSNEPSTFAVVRLRLLGPLRTLESAGKLQLTFVWKDDATLDLERLLDADLFVIHREFANRKLCGAVVAAAKLLGKPIVFELDDLLTEVPVSNPNHLHCAALAPHLRLMLSDADFVTASTSSLAEELGKLDNTFAVKTHVLENRLDAALWGSTPPAPRPRDGRPLVIGWMGTATHADDLAVAAPALAYVLRRHCGKVVFRCWGAMPDCVASIEGVELARGPEPDVAKHAAALRRERIDIAIAPLTDSVFNRAKSNLKWLEYSFCGIPGIFSKVTPYATTIQNHVTGLVVENTTEAWVDGLERMISDATLRERIARAAWDAASTDYRLDRQAYRWDHAYRAFVASGPVKPLSPEEVATGRERGLAALWAEQSNRYLMKGLVHPSVDALCEAVTLDPTWNQAAVELGVRLSKGHLDGAAERCFAAAASLTNPPNEAAVHLAKLQQSTGDPVAAEHTLRAARSSIAAWSLAVELHAAGRQEEARAEWVRAIAASADPADLLDMANSLLTFGEAQDALGALRRALDIRPDDPSLAHMLGELTEKAGIVRPRPRTTDKDRKGALHVAVLTAGSLASPRFQMRVGRPIAELSRQGSVQTAFTNGTVNTTSAVNADVLWVTEDFAASHPPEFLGALDAANKPILLDLDLDKTPVSEAWLAASTRIVVAHGSVLRELRARHAASFERFIQIPDALDLSSWAWQQEPAAVTRNAPLTLGFWTDGIESPETWALLDAIVNAFEQTAGRARLRWFGPLPERFAARKSILNVGSSNSTYRELVANLGTTQVDWALALGAPGEAERRWLRFAGRQIASLVPESALGGSLRHGETAWRVPPGKTAWLQAIATLGADSVKSARIARTAWVEAITRRTVQQNCGEVLTVLRSLVNETIAVG